MKDISVGAGGWAGGAGQPILAAAIAAVTLDRRDFFDNPFRPRREVRIAAVTGAALVYLVGDFHLRLILIHVCCVQHGTRLDCRAASEQLYGLRYHIDAVDGATHRKHHCRKIAGAALVVARDFCGVGKEKTLRMDDGYN